MANMRKFNREIADKILRHIARTPATYANTDVDPSRFNQNYCITPGVDIPREQQASRIEDVYEYERMLYDRELESVFVYNRANVNTLVSVIVDLPDEIIGCDLATEERFFRGCADFLSDRYGGHCVSVHVHKDEGVDLSAKLEDFKNIDAHIGKPHMHYCFVPCVDIDRAREDAKKAANRAYIPENYKERVCADELINRQDLRTLHPDLNAYINDVVGIRCNLNSGITAKNGGNVSVEELKNRTDKAAEYIRNYSSEVDRLRSSMRDIAVRVDAELKSRDAEIERLRGALVNAAEKVDTALKAKDAEISALKAENKDLKIKNNELVERTPEPAIRESEEDMNLKTITAELQSIANDATSTRGDTSVTANMSHASQFFNTMSQELSAIARAGEKTVDALAGVTNDLTVEM